jgi:hypothetical protein
MEPSGAAPAIDRALLQTDLEQLPPRHYPVLPLCQIRDRGIKSTSPR